MGSVAIVLRHARAVVSCPIRTSHGPGWHCADNWEALEAAALEVIAHTMVDGPFVYRCPALLARQAVFVLPDAPVQATLFAESEAQP